MQKRLIRRRTLIGGASALAAGLSGGGRAQGADQPAPSALPLDATTGMVRIAPLGLSMTLPAGLGYLDAAQTTSIFTQIYHDPPEDTAGAFGCILPVPPRPGAHGSFEIVIRASGEPVTDTGPGSSLDPATILRAYRSRIASLNDQRPSGQRFTDPGIVIPARYDRARHVLTVGTSFLWPGESVPSVNLNGFLLTRTGAVILTATSLLPYMHRVDQAMRAVIDGISVDPSERYVAAPAQPGSSQTLDSLAEAPSG